MRTIFGLMVIAGGVALAVVIGQRLSSDAMAVMLGVVFGVAAAIPTSLLVIVATRGRRDQEPSSRRSDFVPPPAPPQIYIVNPGQAPSLHQPQARGELLHRADDLYTAQPARRFKIVGEDERWLDADDWHEID